VDESEVLTLRMRNTTSNKHAFKIPFVCGARNLASPARLGAGAAMIPHQREAGTGDVG
jgi:pyridoxal 5'-phosphate synthase pdxS subunit